MRSRIRDKEISILIHSECLSLFPVSCLHNLISSGREGHPSDFWVRKSHSCQRYAILSWHFIDSSQVPCPLLKDGQKGSMVTPVVPDQVLCKESSLASLRLSRRYVRLTRCSSPETDILPWTQKRRLPRKQHLYEKNQRTSGDR